MQEEKIHPSLACPTSTNDILNFSATRFRPTINPWLGAPTEPSATTLRNDLCDTDSPIDNGPSKPVASIIQNVFGQPPVQLSMRTGEAPPNDLNIDLDDVSVMEGFQVELGYRTIYVTAESMRRSPFQTRCILCCCPCCFGGLSRSLQEFVQSGAVWSLTFWITCLDVAVFLVEIGLGGVTAVEENPMLGPSACLLIRMQAKWSPAIVYRFQLWRLVVPMFLHSGFVHIFMNLYTQLLLGLQSEFRWGRPAFLAVYLASGVGGNILSAVLSPHVVSLGASGAILGLVGGGAGQLIASWPHVDPQVRVVQVGGLVASGAILAVLGAFAPVDNWTHLGGFVTGLVIGLYLYRSRLLSAAARRACVALAAVLVGGAGGLVASLFVVGCEDISCADLLAQIGCQDSHGGCYEAGPGE